MEPERSQTSRIKLKKEEVDHMIQNEEDTPKWVGNNGSFLLPLGCVWMEELQLFFEQFVHTKVTWI